MVRRLAVALLPALLLAACESREVEKDLKIVNVHTGWYDAGILGGGQNKLVPSISLELQNVSDREIASVQMQAVFRRVGEQEAWGDHFVRAIDTNGLAAGATTKPIILRSPLGYTGSDSRASGCFRIGSSSMPTSRFWAGMAGAPGRRWGSTRSTGSSSPNSHSRFATPNPQFPNPRH